MTDPASPTRSDHADAASWSPARRRVLYGAVAATATAAGAGLAWWQSRAGPGGAASRLPLWGMAFPTPGGEPLAMRTFAGHPLLMNFWATWCPPCVEEMPLLDRFYRDNKDNGWQVLGMAVDQKDAVERFLQRAPVGFPITLAGMAGVDLSRQLGNQAGGLPFSVLFDAAGQIVQRKIGRVSPQDLQQWRDLH